MRHWRDFAMAKIIEFGPGARVDFDESFDWYAERSHAAAIGFAQAVEDAFDKILKNPRRFSATVRGCRYCALKRYPFRIIFHEDENHIVIVAVAHAKRRSTYWRNRI
jgi:plasmid stabilization system protein ParE